MSWWPARRAGTAVNSFRNLELEVHGYERDGEVERLRVRVRDSPGGEQGADESETVELPPQLRHRARQLETRDLARPDLVRLGEDLASVMLPLAARELYHRSLDRLAATEGLRIQLRLGTWALATLPWEYAYLQPRGAPAREKVGLGFLGLDRRLSLVRYEIPAVPGAGLDPVAESHLRLLALTAEPRGAAALALERETASIREAVRGIDTLRFEAHPSATWGRLQSELDRAAHILHFAGHGRFEVEMGEDYGTVEGRGTLLFETEDGEADPIPAEEVALNLHRTGVRLVVLAACEGGRVDGIRAWSGIAPALARSGIPAVVAMQFRVRDDKALAFSRRFYQNLAAGGSVDTAVTAGRLAMYDGGDDYGRDWGAPVLYLNAAEGALFPRPVEEKPVLTRRFAANAALGLLLFVLAMFYYLLHWAPRFSDLYLLGGASLPVVLSLLTAAIDKLFETAIMDSVRDWLKKPRATPWLGAACIAMFALGLTTSSLYLMPEAEAETESGTRVRVSSPDLRLDRTWTLTGRPAGEIFWFRIWRPTSVTLKPGEGTGYVERTRTLYPWHSRRHRVPADFERKRPRLLCLLPALGIHHKFATGDHVMLRVTAGDGPPIEIANPPRRGLVIGERRAEMKRVLEAAAAKLEEQLRQHLQSGQIDPAGHEGWIAMWSDHWTEREILLKPSDEVLVEVIENGEIIFEESVPASPREQVRPVFMEVIP